MSPRSGRARPTTRASPRTLRRLTVPGAARRSFVLLDVQPLLSASVAYDAALDAAHEAAHGAAHETLQGPVAPGEMAPTGGVADPSLWLAAWALAVPPHAARERAPRSRDIASSPQKLTQRRPHNLAGK